MPCPTCSHTIHAVVTGPNSENVHHCPRCGTLVRTAGEWVTVDVPKLVERCRRFETALFADAGRKPNVFLLASDWSIIGIAESINGPRPEPPKAA